MKQRVSIVLLVLAYTLLLYTSLAAPAYAHAHPHLDPSLIAEYTRPWPVALASALSMVGIALAVIPIRRGELWAVATSLGMLVILLVTRLLSDSRCLAVLDPHQLGCHTFMIAVVLGLVGLALSVRR